MNPESRLICWISVTLSLLVTLIVLIFYCVYYPSLPVTNEGLVVQSSTSDGCLYGRYLFPSNHICEEIHPTTSIYEVTCNISGWEQGTAHLYLDIHSCTTLTNIPAFFETIWAPIVVFLLGVIFIYGFAQSGISFIVLRISSRTSTSNSAEPPTYQSVIDNVLGPPPQYTA